MLLMSGSDQRFVNGLLQNSAMIDVKDILDNDTVRGMLSKIGVSDEQADKVANQAVSAVKSKFKENPKQMSSLLSENPNTEDDEKMASSVSDDFVERLVKKVGLPEGVADKAKELMPDVLSQVTGKLSSQGKNDESGISGLLEGITDFFDGDDDKKSGRKKKSKGGILGILGGLFGK